jgi:hypothetical protein
MNKPRLPSTNDSEELARFWQEHDITDFEDELEEVTDLVFARAEPPMSSTATIVNVHFHEDTLTVDLSDGRKVNAPLSWHPRLWHGTAAERNHWRLIGKGVGVHWPDLDEDISVEGLILGKPSNESQKSLQQWLAQRSNA